MTSDDFLPAATGVGMHTQLVGKELAARGNRVAMITSRRAGEPETETWNGITIYRTFTLKVYGFYQALPSRGALRGIFDRERPDVVHHHYFGFMMKRAATVAEERSLPQVSTFHFSAEVLTQPLPMRPFRGLIRGQIRGTCNRFDLVIAPSRNLASQLAADGIRTEIRYITNPVVMGETGGVVPAPRDAAFTMLYVGRLGPEKNLPYLLRAVARLAKTVPDWTLWIVGTGPESEAVKRLADEFGVGRRVHMLGFLDHAALAPYYAACDVFILPSLQEAQPLVVMEAMWFSRPVIVTRAIVAASELVEQGENGYIVDPDSIEDLASRLSALAADPALRRRMGEASRRRADAYRPAHVVDALEDAYRGVLKHRAHV